MPRQSEYRSTSPFPADRYYAVMVDPDYLRTRLASIGGQDAELLEHAADAAGARFRVQQGLESQDLPQIVRSFLSGDVVIERTEIWTHKEAGRYDGDSQVTIRGVPASAVGGMRLRDLDPSTSEFVVRTDVSVNVPIIGGAIESVVAERVKELLQMETEFTLDWLATH
jgi:hypothetical protein